MTLMLQAGFSLCDMEKVTLYTLLVQLLLTCFCFLVAGPAVKNRKKEVSHHF